MELEPDDAAGVVIVTVEPSGKVIVVVVEPSLLVTALLDAPASACIKGSLLEEPLPPALPESPDWPEPPACI